MLKVEAAEKCGGSTFAHHDDDPDPDGPPALCSSSSDDEDDDYEPNDCFPDVDSDKETDPVNNMDTMSDECDDEDLDLANSPTISVPIIKVTSDLGAGRESSETDALVDSGASTTLASEEAMIRMLGDEYDSRVTLPKAGVRFQLANKTFCKPAGHVVLTLNL